MAWTDLLNSVLAHKKPVTLQIMRALRDNVIAAFAGDSGAPRLVTSALQAPTAGTGFILARVRDVSAAATTVASSEDLHVVKGGVIRAAFVDDVGTGSGAASIKIFRQGSSLTEVYSNTVPGLGATTVDITVSQGDYLTFSATGSGTNSTTITSIVLSSAADGGIIA